MSARPTFDPVRGGQSRGEKDLSAISKQCSSRDLPSLSKLKYREHDQRTVEELRKCDFRREELEERKREAKDESASRNAKRTKVDQVPAASLDADDPSLLDEDDSESESDDDEYEVLENSMAELQRIVNENAANQDTKSLDADDPSLLDEDDSESESDEDDSELDSDHKDAVALILARVADKAKKEQGRKREREGFKLKNILSGNPLLNYEMRSGRSEITPETTWIDLVVDFLLN